MPPISKLPIKLLSALLLVQAPLSAATVPAVYLTAGDVPVTAATYTATGNTLDFTLNFAPPVGTKLTVVKTSGLPFIQGTFDNLAQGQRVNLTYGGITYRFVANYFGGSGNDLVLHWADARLLVWGNNPNPSPPRTMTAVATDGVLAGKTILDATAGESNSLVLCSDGTVVGWGDNSYGQLGNGTFYSGTLVEVVRNGALAGKTVISISSGRHHSIALCSDGTVATWGNNGNGQLGNNSKTTSNVPVAVDRSGVLAGKTIVAAHAGQSHCLVQCSDGNMAAWGSNQFSQLGNSSYTLSTVPIAVDQSGALAGKTVVALDVGSNHNLALCSDGSLASWGYNLYGQLGNGSLASSNVPVPVDLTGVLSGKTIVTISGGNLFSVVTCADGTLASWGRNATGQLGSGSGADRSRPGLVNRSGVLLGKTVTAVDAGFSHALALCSDGVLAAWGYNFYWALGVNTTQDINPPVLSSTVALRPGERFMGCATGDTSNHSLGLVASLPPPTATTSDAASIKDTGATFHGSVNAAGASTQVTFEYGTTPSYGSHLAAAPSPVAGTTTTPVAAPVANLLPGTTYHFRVVSSNANGTSFGNDKTFTTTAFSTLSGLSLSAGTASPAFASATARYVATVPFSVSEFALTPVATYPAATIRVNGVVTPSGNSSVPIGLAVGDNTITTVVSSADGINTLNYVLTVTRLPEVLGFTSAADVPVTSGGFSFGHATANLSLGFPPATGANLTVLNNTGLDFIHGTFDNLADGQLILLEHGNTRYAFVANYHGGDGNDLVLQWANNRIVGWGWNSYGQLGNNSTTDRLVPTPVEMNGVLAGKTITAVAAGEYHSLVLCSDGTLAAWGSNDYGQLGNNSTFNSPVPVAVNRQGVLAGRKVIAIGAWGYHCLALCSDGTLAAWGYGGQLGNNSYQSSSVPVLIDTSGALAGKSVAAIPRGFGINLALCTDGTLVSWGENQYGQLGNNSKVIISEVPVKVDRTGVLSGKAIQSIHGGGYCGFAKCTDGTLASWGYNWEGQLGNSTATPSPVPVQVNLTSNLSGKSIARVFPGIFHNLALCTDGSVAGWGQNYNGELGNSSATSITAPQLMATTGALSGKTVVSMAAGGGNSLGLCSDGTLAAWGYNGYGQLGNNTRTSSVAPVAVSTASLRTGERVAEICASFFHDLALTALPPVTAATLPATAITGTSVSMNGTVNAQGNPTAVGFEFGLDTSYGRTVSGSPASVSTTVNSSVSAVAGGLLPGTTYHYRVVAAGNRGGNKGGDMTFTTSYPPQFAGYSISTPFQTPATLSLRKLLGKATDPYGGSMSVTAAGPASLHGGTAILQASGILYTPPAGFSGNDTFSVTITNNLNASVTATVTVAVGLNAAAGGLTANPPKITTLADGSVELRFHGIPGRTYQIQRSTDLNTWATIGSRNADSLGALTFTDATPPQPSAFYRLSEP